MKKRILAVTLSLVIALSIFTPANAVVSADAIAAATKLNTLGLFQGVGTNEDGTPDFDLDRAPTRAEAITMFVRLLGKDAEAKSGEWTTPFTDVPVWAEPYVGYAYTNGLTLGTGASTFGSGSAATVSQYLTFVLRALGYSSDTDFAWDKAWELSDDLGFTSGEYSASAGEFMRGNVAIVSFNALSAVDKNTGKALYLLLIDSGVISQEDADSVGLGAADTPGILQPSQDGFKLTLINEDPSSGELKAYIAAENAGRFDPDVDEEIPSGGSAAENNRVNIFISGIPEDRRIRDVLLNDSSVRQGILSGVYGFLSITLSKDTTVSVTFEDVPAVLPAITGISVYKDAMKTNILAPGADIRVGDIIYSEPIFSDGNSDGDALCKWEYADAANAEVWTEIMWWRGYFQLQTGNIGGGDIELSGKYVRARMNGLDKYSTGEATSAVFHVT